MLTLLIFVAKAAETESLGLILQIHLPVQTAMSEAHPQDGGREWGDLCPQQIVSENMGISHSFFCNLE